MSPDPGTDPGAPADPGAQAGASAGPDSGRPADAVPEAGAAPGTAGADAADTSAADPGAVDPGAVDPGGAKRRKRSFWRDLAVIVVAALILVILLKTFVVQVFSIPSGSMENTLMPGDRILVSKIVYQFRSIERGDIVVFSGAGSWDAPTPPPGNLLDRIGDNLTGLVGIAGPGTDYVKRVIGVPGDHVVCCNTQGQVTVNGVPLSESSYVYPGDAPSEVPFNITVPAGRLWVMGDNRGDSDDSRYRTNDPGGGTIPESAVVGRAFLIIWPVTRISDLPIPNTFQQAGLSAAAAVATAPPAAVGGGTAALAGAAFVWRRRRR
jgi:signal peptidase I